MVERTLDEEPSAKAGPPAPGGLVTILFTDMESSTALRRKLGDAKVQELVRAHNEIVRAPALAEIERRCPILLGDTSITFDRGDDYSRSRQRHGQRGLYTDQVYF